MKKYYYLGEEYDSLDAANVAASNHKTKMETQPSEFIKIKEVTGSDESGWTISSTTLTDNEILAIHSTSDKHYSVSSIHHGDNEIGLTAAEAIAEIDRLMKKYGSWARVDIITLIEDLATETDMTAFLESSEVE